MNDLSLHIIDIIQNSISAGAKAIKLIVVENLIDDKLIIGDDPGGNFYLILNGSESQGVYYWDRTHLHAEDDIQEFEIAEQNECGNIYKITNSFTEFYKKICETSLDAGMNVTVDL